MSSIPIDIISHSLSIHLSNERAIRWHATHMYSVFNPYDLKAVVKERSSFKSISAFALIGLWKCVNLFFSSAILLTIHLYYFTKVTHMTRICISVRFLPQAIKHCIIYAKITSKNILRHDILYENLVFHDCQSYIHDHLRFECHSVWKPEMFCQNLSFSLMIYLYFVDR